MLKRNRRVDGLCHPQADLLPPGFLFFSQLLKESLQDRQPNILKKSINMNSNKVNNFSDYVHTRPHPTPQLSQLFTRLNKPLLHASAGDKSLHPALTGSVINHSLTDPRLDWTVCLCSVTLLPWCASRFTPTKSQWQTCTLPRTRVSSLRHLSDGPESRQGPRCPALLPHILALKRLETSCGPSLAWLE